MPTRTALSLLVLAAFAAPVAAAEARLPAGVKVAECSVPDRSAVFAARMRSVPGAERMALRFTLLEKSATGYRPLRAPGLGRWRRSKPGVGEFGYRQGVRGLRTGGLYRAAVEFRWYDAEGETVASARRRSSSCRQFDGVPNLVALVTGARPRAAGTVRYGLAVRNDGFAPAFSVPVQLAVDDHVVDTVVLGSLFPGERRAVEIGGPACTSHVEAGVDPDGLIVESSELDNLHRLLCAQLPPP
jgi:hypothetical protein